MIGRFTGGLILVLGLTESLGAQAGPLSCRERDDDDWGSRFCTIVEKTLDPAGTIRVNAHPNGGVRVVGWDENKISLRAKISARARTETRAEEIGEQVKLAIAGVDISVDGPRLTGRNRESWWVSFELRVPKTSDLWIRAQNGGIDVEGVRGDIDLDTVNGGLSLRALAGNVKAETTNGGVDVELVGKRWDGDGLDVRTVNGGVDLAIPEGYSADLETGTVNGGIDFDFPVQVKGRLTKRIATTLGSGGAPVKVNTTNGGVTVRRG